MGCAQCRPKYQGLKDYLKGVSIGFVAFVGAEKPGTNPRLQKKRHVGGTRAGPRGVTTCAPNAGPFRARQGVLTSLGRSFPQSPVGARSRYYTKTVFEVIAPGMGRKTLPAAGAMMVWPKNAAAETPAVGFTAGMEQLLLALESQGQLPLPES